MAKSKKPAKSAKPAKKPAKKVAAKSTAKAKPSKAKPTKAKPTKKTVAKPVKKTAAAKPKKAASKAKKPAKPKKSGTQFVSLMAAGPAGPGGPGTIGAGGVSAPATPQITLPLANANVTAGTDLLVTMTTNQTGFRYILELLDLAPPSTPVNFNIAAPGSSPFNHTIPGANLHATRNYRLRVCVDPGDGLTPPNLDHAIPIST